MLLAHSSLTGTKAGEQSDCSESFERLAGLSGHWTGSWMNHTFNSNGTLTVDALVSPDCTAQATITGLFQQPERTVSAEYRDQAGGTEVTVVDHEVFGDATVGLTGSGEITIQGSGAHQGIESYSGTGEMTGIDISLQLTLNFQGGGSATESVELRKDVAIIQGDLDCDGNVDSHDALRIFLHQAELLGFLPGCLRLVEDEVSALPWGDVNCDGLVDTGDGVAILLYDASLGSTQGDSCRPMGEEFNG